MNGDGTQSIDFEHGSEAFLKSVVFTYTKILYNFIRRFGFTNEETEDVLQDVFIKVWKYRDTFEEEKSSFKTWIFTITKNTIYDALRKKKNTKIILSFDEKDGDDDGGIKETEDISQNILTILERNHSKKLLLESFEFLNEEEKTILLLHFEESLTFNEISTIFNTPLNTVKSKYRRSLIKLQGILEHMHQNIN